MSERGLERWAVGDWLEAPLLEPVVSRIAAHIGIGAQEVPDLVQEVRIALWEKGLDVRIGLGFVIRVATNKAIDLIREQARCRVRDRGIAMLGPIVNRNDELRRLLQAEVSLLPRKLRLFVDLHYGRGLSEREIGRRWHLCRGSVRWLDRQSIRFMRDGSDEPPTRAADRRECRPGSAAPALGGQLSC